MNSFALLPTRRWLLLALAAVLFFPLAVAAQDRPDRAERLKQALDLTDAQVAVVNEALGDEVGPGSLWNVAAALTPTLTDEQKEKLFTRPVRGAHGARMQNRRSDHGQRGERPQSERPDADARTERHAAMQEALDLSDVQVQQLEALHADKRAEWEAQREQRQAQRPGPGELPAEMAAILTPAQQEVAKVHRALAAHMIHGRHRGGARR